jgi:hypothetical protein
MRRKQVNLLTGLVITKKAVQREAARRLGVPLPGGQRSWPMILTGAQRAPGFLLVVDRMPAYARTRGDRQEVAVFAVAQWFHEPTPYVDGLTSLS